MKRLFEYFREHNYLSHDEAMILAKHLVMCDESQKKVDDKKTYFNIFNNQLSHAIKTGNRIQVTKAITLKQDELNLLKEALEKAKNDIGFIDENDVLDNGRIKFLKLRPLWASVLKEYYESHSQGV